MKKKKLTIEQIKEKEREELSSGFKTYKTIDNKTRILTRKK